MSHWNDARALDRYLPSEPLLTGSQTAKILGFPSTEALYKARQTGRLSIQLFQLPGRRGWFASTEAVRDWLSTNIPAPPKRA
jgi:hypothetical protein